MVSHRVGTPEEWLAESTELLRREKEYTRMGDELARQRQGLPWVPVEKEYTLQTADGNRTLTQLFEFELAVSRLPLHVRPRLSGRMSRLLGDRRQLQRGTRSPQGL